jgi:2-polyprenyl-3-methyl-5-hydroxy-6-metoxy-1,4-benzoquinol methylase
MTPPIDLDKQQRQSWSPNAAAWTEAVRSQLIESRRVATDAAILEAIIARAPRRVLDCGCGEGWLCRALNDQHIDTVGIDVSPELIAAARRKGDGDYRVCSYAELSTEAEQVSAPFDVVVCNFSLLEEKLEPFLGSLTRLLGSGGTLLIQTVHPFSNPEQPYQSGWRTEGFRDFGGAFPELMPWYFRTLADWLNLLRGGGLEVQEIREPLHPTTEGPLSLILAATCRRPADKG